MARLRRLILCAFPVRAWLVLSLLLLACKPPDKQPPRAQLPADFDPKVYLALNPDVAEAHVDPAKHYLSFGMRESRRYRRSADGGVLPADFDPKLYLELNEDVAAAGLDPAEHYLNFGAGESRPYRRADLPADFDPKVYLKLNPDVAAAGAEPALHYQTYGAREGRKYRIGAAPDAGAAPTPPAAHTPPVAKRRAKAAAAKEPQGAPAP
jgi:hypothetical protein